MASVAFVCIVQRYRGPTLVLGAVLSPAARGGSDIPGPGIQRSLRNDGGMAERTPGNLILDSYMPHASVDERDAARENLQRLARLILRIHTRLESNPQNEIRAMSTHAVDSESPPPIYE